MDLFVLTDVTCLGELPGGVQLFVPLEVTPLLLRPSQFLEVPGFGSNVTSLYVF